MLWTIPIRVFLFIIIMLMDSWTFPSNPIVMRDVFLKWFVWIHLYNVHHWVLFFVCCDVFPDFIYFYIFRHFSFSVSRLLQSLSFQFVYEHQHETLFSYLCCFVLFIHSFQFQQKHLPFSDNIYFFICWKENYCPLVDLVWCMGTWVPECHKLFFFLSKYYTLTSFKTDVQWIKDKVFNIKNP